MSLPVAHPSSGLKGGLESFLTYSFATDAQYQQGLAGILNSGVPEGTSEDEKGDILLRAEVFYYNRVTGASIDFDEALEARRGQRSVENNTAAATLPSVETRRRVDEPQTQTLSFIQLKELIEQGRTDQIPNNKVIPNVLSSETPSESKAALRRKPWEAHTGL